MRTQAGTTLFFCALFSNASCSAPTEAISSGVAGLDGSFETDTLIIQADDGSRHNFDVYLAIEPQQQRRGLMYVRSMPPQTGMLFVYDGEDTRSIWMKNTYLPLDLVFAKSDGTVSSVIHDTTPLSLTSMRSVEPVRFVLELNAGTARRLNIGYKSRILWQPASD